MTARPTVLVVDDQIGDLFWLLNLIRNRGHDVVVATNERAARDRLRAVKEGSEAYTLAIIDVMVAVEDLMELVTLDDRFFEDSRNTGIRLCNYARNELHLSNDDLTIACLTVRDDDQVRQAMQGLGIPLFNRAPYSASDSIRGFIETKLTSAIV